MKVQEILTTDGQTRYVVVDGDGEFVIPVCRYLKWMGDVGRARHTLRAYAYDLSLYSEFLAEGGIDYLSPTIDTMGRFVFWLKNPYRSLDLVPREPLEQARSNKTVNRALAAVVTFYDYLRRKEGMEQDINALIHVDKPRHMIPYKGFLHHLAGNLTFRSNVMRQPVPKEKLKTLTPEEIGRLERAAGNPRDALLIGFLFQSALRIGEALALWLEDIDTPRCAVTVRDRGQLENGAEIKTPSSRRTVYVSRDLINQIQDYVAVYHTDEVETNHLFIKLRGQRAGRPMSYPEVNDLFQRLKQKTGIGTSAHVLRHSSLTEFARDGWRPEMLSERGGHAQVQSTYVYIHPNDEDMRRASERSQSRLRMPAVSQPNTPAEINAEEEID